MKLSLVECPRLVIIPSYGTLYLLGHNPYHWGQQLLPQIEGKGLWPMVALTVKAAVPLPGSFLWDGKSKILRS